MSSPLRPAEWNRHWHLVCVAHPAPELLTELLQRYAEPHRAYHTQAHLADCLTLLNEFEAICDHPGEVALALWFHDAVYDVRAKDNEERSAAWLEEEALQAGTAPAAAARMRSLVLATRHQAIPDSSDARLLVDIDLSILGADPERYARFETEIRAEYAWVPGPLFRRERGKILKGFLDRSSIYSTNELRARFESRARTNLSRTLAALRQ
jgi:predicted metal-dependent HD superfamily phosphohydrolase